MLQLLALELDTGTYPKPITLNGRRKTKLKYKKSIVWNALGFTIWAEVIGKKEENQRTDKNVNWCKECIVLLIWEDYSGLKRGLWLFSQDLILLCNHAFSGNYA